MTTVNPNDMYVSTGEVAARLKIGEQALRYWRHMGQGPRSVYAFGRVLWDRADVARFEAEVQAVAKILGKYTEPEAAFSRARTVVAGVYVPGGDA